MPASTLTWYKRKAKRIMRDVNSLRRQTVADALNESHQLISYRMKNVYPGQLEDWVQLLDMAGYEIKEKEE